MNDQATNTTEPSGSPLVRGVRRAVLAMRQWRCRHVFRGVDMGPRDADGLLVWPCNKCGKEHRMEYGLLAPGEITGPWGVRDERA